MNADNANSTVGQTEAAKWNRYANLCFRAFVQLFMVGWLIGSAGVEWEISKLPLELQIYSDHDWVGVEWLFLGMVFGTAGFLALAAGVAFRIIGTQEDY